jgi:hypothetical protein
MIIIDVFWWVLNLGYDGGDAGLLELPTLIGLEPHRFEC